MISALTQDQHCVTPSASYEIGNPAYLPPVIVHLVRPVLGDAAGAVRQCLHSVFHERRRISGHEVSIAVDFTRCWLSTKFMSLDDRLKEWILRCQPEAVSAQEYFHRGIQTGIIRRHLSKPATQKVGDPER